MDKRFWGIVVAVVVILIGIFVITNHNKPGSTNTSAQPSNHVEGQGQDNITLVEYGDYQCPYCGQYFPIVKQVASTYNQYIHFQFRNLPLTQLHPNAFAGARAAEAASLMGKFWQMHDLLYQQNQEYYNSNQTLSTWISASNPLTDFDEYATSLGLNVTKFNQYFNSSQVNNTINADVSAFNATGAQEGTPTFFLDGKQVQPNETLSSFEQIINAEIQKKTGKPSPVAVSSTPSTSTATPQSVQ